MLRDPVYMPDNEPCPVCGAPSNYLGMDDRGVVFRCGGTPMSVPCGSWRRLRRGQDGQPHRKLVEVLIAAAGGEAAEKSSRNGVRH